MNILKIKCIILYIFLTLPFCKVYAQIANDFVGPLSCKVFVMNIEKDDSSNDSIILLTYLQGYLSGFIATNEHTKGGRSLKLPDQFTLIAYFKTFCPRNSNLNMSSAAYLASELIFLDIK